MVEPGVADDAEAYYRETFAALGIPHDAVKGEPRMAAMLAYLGTMRRRTGRRWTFK